MKFWIGFALVLLLVSGGVWYYLDHQVTDKGLTASQKEKAMENLLGGAVRTEQKPLEWETHKAHFLSISYPTEANISSTQGAPKNVIDIFSYSLPAEHIIVTAQVKQASDIHDLSEDSNVQVRLLSGDYHVATEAAKSPCQEFHKNADTAEESMFCLGNGRLGSLVVSGPNPDIVQKYYSMLKETFQW